MTVSPLTLSRSSVKEGDTGGTVRGNGTAIALLSHIVDDMYKSDGHISTQQLLHCSSFIPTDCSCLMNLEEIQYYRNYKFVKVSLLSHLSHEVDHIDCLRGITVRSWGNRAPFAHGARPLPLRVQSYDCLTSLRDRCTISS